MNWDRSIVFRSGRVLKLESDGYSFKKEERKRVILWRVKWDYCQLLEVYSWRIDLTDINTFKDRSNKYLNSKESSTLIRMVDLEDWWNSWIKEEEEYDSRWSS